MSFKLISNIFEDLRFKISFNDDATVFYTPQVKSFSISKQRGNIVSTASATLRVRASELKSINPTNSTSLGQFFNDKSAFKIYGLLKNGGGGWKILFKGMVKNVSIRRDFLLTSTYIVEIQAVDILHIIQERTYTRRTRVDNAMGVFAVITGVEQKSLMGRYQQASGGVIRAGGRFNGSSVGFSSSGFKASEIPSKKIKKLSRKTKRMFVKASTVSKEEITVSASGSDSGYFSFLSDTFGLPSGQANMNSKSKHSFFDRGHFKQTSGGTGGVSSSSSGGSGIKIIPSFIMLQPDEELNFKCSDATICAPPEEDSQEGTAYTWSVLYPAYGTLIDGPGGAVIDTKDSDFPATEGVWYRHKGIGSQWNEIVLKDNTTELIGSATIMGLPVHKHAEMKEGGPAYGVYAPTVEET